MAKIKIKDLPRDMKVSRDEMKKVTGGGRLWISRLGSYWSMKTPTFTIERTLGGPVTHSLIVTGTHE